MPRPAPKPKEERRNRNLKGRGEWVDLQKLDKPILPPLPGGQWDDEVRDLWNAWRKTPVTSQYDEGDIAYALETIRIRQRSPNKLSELRQRMDALGLTPKGKRDLRWREGGYQDQPARTARPPSKQASISRRARLSVVD